MTLPRYLLTVFGVVIASGSASAQFTRIVDTLTMNPAGSAAFGNLDNFPAISGGVVAFRAIGGGPEGVFASSGAAVSTIAAAGMADPFGGAPLGLFNSPDISGTRIAFPASPTGAFGPTGVYTGTFPSGGLVGVANTATPIPSGTGNFAGFGFPVAVSGTNVAFVGGNPSVPGGIYATVGAGGSLVRIASTAVAVPGGAGNFMSFSTPVISGTTVAINAIGGGRQGTYANTGAGGAIAVVADTTTTIPNGTGVFTAFPPQPPAISGTNIAFVATGSGNQEGVYRSTVGGLTRIADKTTTVPGGTGTFSDFNPLVAIEGTTVAFVGTDSAGERGLFLFNGMLSKVIAIGDLIGSETVTDLNFGPYGLEDGHLTLWVRLDGYTQAIYRVTPVPEPTLLLLVGLGIAGVYRRRR